MKSRTAYLIIALGVWLIAAPLTFSSRIDGFGYSDLCSGLLLVILGALSIAERRVWSGWAVGIVGLWLQFAPLLFWAPSAWMYLNNTLIGSIAIVLCFQLAKEPVPAIDDEMPLGWSCAPSTWNYRIPTVGLAILCWFFSRYMAAFQLGYIDHIWDPFFKNGTLHVITSKISKDFPVSDAGLGAFSYSLEFLLGWQGSTRRFATMPWLVLFFGFLVIPVSVVSIMLIILQPVAVGAWCSWCLATAAVMLIMIVLTAGELAAALELMYDAKRRKDSLWQVFWKGEKIDPALVQHRKVEKREGLGITFPWNLLLSILIGIWLMVSPSHLNVVGGLATSDYILGPLVIAFSVMSLAEVFRSLRFCNLLFGLGLLLAPLFTSHSSAAGIVNNLLFGALIIALAWRKGKITQRYGSWERLIF